MKPMLFKKSRNLFYSNFGRPLKLAVVIKFN